MELKCTVKNYHWGKKGESSLVARLMKSANPEFVLKEDETYAELWMGTHPNGPSLLKDDDVALFDYITDNKHVLGDAYEEKEFTGLPFLFKLLSVKKALSIQIHPDKETAARLHKEQPDVFKDANHKPEIAIAVTPFEAFCGFRAHSELLSYIDLFPELQDVVGDYMQHFREDANIAIKNCFETMLSHTPEVIAEKVQSLMKRLTATKDKYRYVVDVPLLERLNNDYPGDIGVLCYFFFHHMELKVGDGLFIDANEPHAYLSGDCIECMACSDNVIRAGLTPKPKDIKLLKELLTYTWRPWISQKFIPTAENDHTVVYRPPVQDFAVAKIKISGKESSYDLIPRPTASILLMTTGKAEIEPSRKLDRGAAIFVPANEVTTFKTLGEDIVLYQAFENIGHSNVTNEDVVNEDLSDATKENADDVTKEE